MNQPAGSRDLSTMLRPRSIALIGATDRSGWSRMTIENDPVAVSGAERAIDSVPSTCFRPVALVRSRGIGANCSRRRAASIWN